VLVNVSMPSMAGSRPLRVVIGDRLTGTGIKLCDPAFANPIDPKYCPP